MVHAQDLVMEVEVTNIIGQALIILASYTTNITSTAYEQISCAEAGCTNTSDHNYIHTTNKVYIVAVQDVVVIGAPDKPLYRIITQRGREDSGKVWSFYSKSTWIEPMKQEGGASDTL